MTLKNLFIGFSFLAAASCPAAKDGDYAFTILSTGDVHGCWFDSAFAGGKTRPSLMAVQEYADALRDSLGSDKVLLIDAGNMLQGSPAAFYFNEIDREPPHLLPRLAAWMKYDVMAAGPEDAESGAGPRVASELKKAGIACLEAGDWAVVDKGGVRTLVFSLPSAEAVSVRDFQQTVDKVTERTRPQLVAVVVNAKASRFCDSLKRVDLFIGTRSARVKSDSVTVLETGSNCRTLGKCEVTLSVRKGRVVSRSLVPEAVWMDANAAEPAMKKAFREDFLAVDRFVGTPVAELKEDLVSRDAFRGACSYASLFHAAALDCDPVDISLHGPLAVDDTIPAGPVTYGDLPRLYPFGNRMLVVKMTGGEVLDLLEASYAAWVGTVTGPEDPLLEMKRSGPGKWNFAHNPGHFVTAGGIDYVVDVGPRAEDGRRVTVLGMADGSDFDRGKTYRVAVTSYFAIGAGGLLKACAIDPAAIDGRLVMRGPDYRTVLYNYLRSHPAVEADALAKTGTWKFVPEEQAQKALDRDLALIFPK